MSTPEKPIKAAVIGCGGRLGYLVKDLVKNPGIVIHGGWDPDESHTRKLLDGAGNPAGVVYPSYEKACKDPEIDWILVGSPNVFHKEHILCAFAHGKHVFSEKPLATEIDDCTAINDAHQKSGKRFATGFVLRYSQIYRKVREVLDSGALGKIISIDANENITPGHGGYIMMNWRRKRELAGAHILEKCVHDLDLLNWFVGSLPVRIAAFGGNNLYTKENAGLLAKSKAFLGWWSQHRDVDDPFTSDKTIEDNVVAILEYGNQVRVQFQATMGNVIPERRMYFSGTEGNLIVELYAGIVKYKTLASDEIHVFDWSGGDGHGGGDKYIMNELADTMKNGTPPKCGGEEGLRSAVVGITIDEARRSGKVVDLGPVWRRLGVEV
ncbi:MAG: Gfo/Idh/MocA family oxidoreductase [Spirochaetes bacterium]|nr:Gfo/Idh/MocA family oxidoreductase [Spirochaetota bacterium]